MSAPEDDRSDLRWPGDRHPGEPILRGALDLHVHGYPDAGLSWRQRQDDLTLARAASASGMAGIVLKSHFWPTMDRAQILNSVLDDPSFTVHSSITLNPLIGGVQATTVEAAAGHGARVVFMPTWGSRNDHGHGGVVRRAIIDREFPSFGTYLDRHAVRIVDDSGRLDPRAADVVRVCHERDLVLSTGHLSVDESLRLAELGADLGYRRLVFSHPFSSSIAASADAIDEMAGLGATVEMTAVLTMMARPPVGVEAMYDTIQRIGAARVVISSDVYFDWCPPHVDMLRMTIGQLRTLGMTEPDLRAVFADNPSRLLASTSDAGTSSQEIS
jgi:hypothetical protein